MCSHYKSKFYPKILNVFNLSTRNYSNPPNDNFSQRYPSARKSSEKKLTQMVDILKLGASVNKFVRKFNNDNCNCSLKDTNLKHNLKNFLI
jgi:hypothetical protein